MLCKIEFFNVKSVLRILKFCFRSEIFEFLVFPGDPGRPSSFRFLDTSKTSKISPLGQKFKNPRPLFYVKH